jgi:hypothetical protein
MKTTDRVSPSAQSLTGQSCSSSTEARKRQVRDLRTRASQCLANLVQPALALRAHVQARPSDFDAVKLLDLWKAAEAAYRVHPTPLVYAIYAIHEAQGNAPGTLDWPRGTLEVQQPHAETGDPRARLTRLIECFVEPMEALLSFVHETSDFDPVRFMTLWDRVEAVWRRFPRGLVYAIYALQPAEEATPESDSQ